MVRYYSINGDIVPKIACDVCGFETAQGEQVQVIWTDVPEGHEIVPVIGHNACTYRVEGNAPGGWNNQHFDEVLEKIQGILK